MSNNRKKPEYPNKYTTAHSIADGKYFILEDSSAETNYGRQRWMSVRQLNNGPDLFLWIPRACNVPEESQIGKFLEKTTMESNYRDPYYGVNYWIRFDFKMTKN
jgi:hypothetical protein